MHLGLNGSSSAHNCGYTVDGGNAMAAISVLLLLLLLLRLPYMTSFFSDIPVREHHRIYINYNYTYGVILLRLPEYNDNLYNAQ